MSGSGSLRAPGATAGSPVSATARAGLAAAFIGPPTPPSGTQTQQGPASRSTASTVTKYLMEYTFKIGISAPTGSVNNDGAPRFGFDMRYPVINMELPPARKSYHEKQGQQIPGADAGFVHVASANLVCLNVPAGQVIYQHLGIKKECIEFVGAFCGFDNYESSINKIVNDSTTTRTRNAKAQYADLKSIVRVGREMMIEMRWHGASQFEISYMQKTNYHGTITEFEAVYATEQKIYYRIQMELNNKENILSSMEGRHKGMALTGVPLPPLTPLASGTSGKHLYDATVNGPIDFGGSSGNGYDSKPNPTGGAAPAAGQSTRDPEAINQIITNGRGILDVPNSAKGVAQARRSVQVIDEYRQDPAYSGDANFMRNSERARKNYEEYIKRVGNTYDPNSKSNGIGQSGLGFGR